jgi:hypothetical protein
MYYFKNMAALFSALDKHQIGEKGHVEYSWSTDLQEQLLQLSFQLVRTDNIIPIQLKFRGILANMVQNGTPELWKILYKLVGQTRDIIDGKGEYKLAYMMIYEWYDINKRQAEFLLRSFVFSDVHPYGSWKDLKYFCEFCDNEGYRNHPLISYCITLYVEQLKIDITSENPSLAAKWIPRETSQFGWIFIRLAEEYFSAYVVSGKTTESKNAGAKKARVQMRLLLSGLNKRLDTVQIKQCGKKWADINHNKNTSITMSKQKKAFLNVDKKGNTRSYDEDRVICAHNFEEFIAGAIKSGKEVKGGRIGMEQFTKLAFDVGGNLIEKDLLDSQWRSNSANTGNLGNMVAVVDTSGSMSGDPLNVAIALGIRIAEKSLLGKRVITFNTVPTWVNLEPNDSFCDMVAVTRIAPWGGSTDFYKTMKLILDTIIANKLKPADVEDMILVVLSDMQIDSSGYKSSMYDGIATMYADAGMKLWNAPFHAPHILFWNLRSTSGFPSMSSQPNVSMMSGFSPALLNMFCEKGIDALKTATPWTILTESLENERYNKLAAFL